MAASAQAANAQNAAVDNEVGGGMNSQQADAAAAVGQGTPVSARPKKRLPSGKRKVGTGSAPDPSIPTQPEVIPPVPPIPDLHRQASPHGMMNHLASPLSAGYHIPPEYQHHQAHHQPSPTNPTFGYPQGNEYGYYAAAVAANPGPMGGQYLGMPGQAQGTHGTHQQHQQQQQQQQHQQQQQQQQMYQQEQRDRARMMMAGEPGRLGMGI
jgi:hypothetical protein